MPSAPYTKTKFTLAPDGAYSKYKYQYGFKNTGVSKKRPSAYLLNNGEVSRWLSLVNGGTYYNPTNPTSRSVHNQLPFRGGHQVARNKAYDKFLGEVNGDSSAIAVTAAERKESYGMIANRAMGLYRSFRALRKGNFRQALKELSVSPKRKHKNKIRNGAHEVSGLWLEYWFGWKPAISDIYTACQQLSEPLPDDAKAYKGGGAAQDTIDIGSQRAFSEIWVNTGGKVRLVNPDAYLAAQMGLINPATVVFELIPFSFLGDWVFDISSFLGSLTDFVGLELSEVWTTEKIDVQWTVRAIPGFTKGEYLAKQVFMERRLEQIRPLPSSDILGNLGVKPTRALTACSLLTQILKI